MDNRLDVLSKTFLGLTVACARCHDHKFDAISQRDYYALAGFAISGSYRQVRVDTFEQDRQIARQLETLRSQTRHQFVSALFAASRSVMDRLDAYWLVAKRALDDDSSISMSVASGQPLVGQAEKLVDDLARDNALDPKQLELWCLELTKAKSDKRHPLHGLLATAPSELASETVGKNHAPVTGAQMPFGVVVNFGDANSHRPIQNGVSFGLSPALPGRLVIHGTPESPQLDVTTVGGWERDLFWKNIQLAPGTEIEHGTLGPWQFHGRMVRSPEFTLASKNLWYLVRGFGPCLRVGQLASHDCWAFAWISVARIQAAGYGMGAGCHMGLSNTGITACTWSFRLRMMRSALSR